MDIPETTVLRRLGSGESIQSVCAATGLTLEAFDAWWKDQTASRVPRSDGTGSAQLKGSAEVLRDEWGVPHIYAGIDEDLFFAYGYAMAQDRLWQLDYLRRKATGRLAEVLGPAALPRDVLARTVGINRIAAREVDQLPSPTLRRLQAFSAGINSLMQESEDRPPIEFDLLDYRPEPWSPLDSVAIWAEFRWYLTGRLPVIVLPELAKRTLGDGPLYEAFLTPEAGDESILPRGSYAPGQSGVVSVGEAVGDPDEGIGSNNWVVAGSRSATGMPMVASDPHIAFGSVSCWYEAHLAGPDFNTVGTGYVGMPTVLFARNERVAWAITNNICSQRDLYQEKTDPQRPGRYLYDGEWEPARELTEVIEVKGAAPVTKTIRFSRNGPIVDELLPEPARDTGPVSLRWLGSTFCDELTPMHTVLAADSCDEFREALRDWRVPTWSFVFADVDGHIGYQAVGRIPLRKSWDRAYRPGSDPEHQWNGTIPYDGMPALADPEQGYVRSANNRTAPDDFPYPLSGTWSVGYRARRVRQMIEEKEKLSREDFARMQQDVLSLRAVDAVPGIVRLSADSSDSRIQAAVHYLNSWDRRMEPESVAATIFESFFLNWSETVAAQRFGEDLVPLIAGGIGGLAVELLSEDRSGWFTTKTPQKAALAAMTRTLDELGERLGPDMGEWVWGRVHTVKLGHHLSDIGDLGQLLDRGGQPVGGDGVTVGNTGFDPTYLASVGANYRLVAELADSAPGLWAVDAAGQSGHPGSPHYCDQLPEWLAGHHHYLPMDRKRVEAGAKSRLVLKSKT